jgi:outer membrane beta-barrel protein
MRNIALVALSLSAVLLAPQIASARKSPLAGQPMVRHKYEYRTSRIELVPLFEGSVGAQYQHTLSGGLKAEFHLTDSLSFGGSVLFGTSISTGLYDEIHGTLPEPGAPFPTPSTDVADDHINRIPLHGSAHVTFTPTFGKMSLFGKAFVAYDIYFFGGLAFAKTENSFGGNDDEVVCDVNNPEEGVLCNEPPMEGVPNPADDPRNDGPHNAGFNMGIAFGGGLHVFINKWIAIDLSLRNYMFSDNPSGLDNNFDRRVDDADRSFMSHLFVGVGVSLYLPPRVKISR